MSKLTALVADTIKRLYKIKYNLANATDAREACIKPSTTQPIDKTKRGRSLQKAQNLRLTEEQQTERADSSNREEKYYKITYEIVVDIQGTDMIFKVLAPPGGQSYAAETYSIADAVENE